MIEGLPKSGATDPIEYYRRPIVGRLFRKRVNIGLGLLEDRTFDSVLEVGYGAGAILLALAPVGTALHGIDLDADPTAATQVLASRGYQATLRQGDVTHLPYDNRSFDLVVSFSVFEHIHDYPKALSEIRRVLRTKGQFLLGMPAVNRIMETGFRAIGFKDINDHHVTTPAAVSKSLSAAGFSTLRSRSLHFPVPGLRLYHTWLLEKAAATR
jgi:ubiquinone/menaquinone biosynthesis C-methylase UbiE